MIVSNKNDQKKRIVTDAEGLSLARSGDRRSYAAVSLVDDTGLDELGAKRILCAYATRRTLAFSRLAHLCICFSTPFSTGIVSRDDE